MKTIILLAVLLSFATFSYAQTVPNTSPAAATKGSAPGVSGTKNVGRDRADAPKAPGIDTTATSSTPATRKRGSKRSKASKASSSALKP